MSARPIIVLAHGAQTRMGDLETPKQLLLLDGQESILGRTYRQCRRLAPERIFVLVAPWATSPAWRESDAGRRIFKDGWPIVHFDGAPGTLVDGIARIADRWRDGATFLLGDVIFSDYALKLALEPGDFTVMIGRPGVNRHTGRRWAELFAMDVPADDVPHMAEILARIQARGLERAGLWQIYAELTGVVGTSRSAWLIDPADWTDDLDEPADLVYLPALARAALSDDQRETAAAER